MNLEAPPAMPLYVNDWRTGEGVLLMDWEARGVFMHLLCVAWDRKPACTLPNDPKLLKKLCGDISSAKWRKAWEQIKDQFREVESGSLLRNEKQWRVYEGIMQRRKAQSKGGKKGAKSTWGTHPDGDGSPNGLPIDLPTDSLISKHTLPAETETVIEESSSASREEGSGEKGPKRKRLPTTESCPLTEAMIAVCREIEPRCEPAEAYAEWLDYCASNHRVYLDFPSTWRNFCRRIEKFSPHLIRDAKPKIRKEFERYA